ncbi:MAG: hypothetical protein N2C14_05735, partial [Planctomycetales bacterium]
LTELVLTKSGKTHSGLVQEIGDSLRIRNANGEVTVPKNQVDQRAIQKLSIMPEGQEKLLSRDELRDLLAYLLSLK